MKGKVRWVDAPKAIPAGMLVCCGQLAFAQNSVEDELRQLKEQLKQQRELIEQLNRKVSQLEGRNLPKY